MSRTYDDGPTSQRFLHEGEVLHRLVLLNGKPLVTEAWKVPATLRIDPLGQREAARIRETDQ